jgi:hypothetical protein
MKYYIYGVTAANVPLPKATGLNGLLLNSIRYKNLQAAVSDLDFELKAAEQHVLQHEAAIEALMLQSTVLPFRFGTVFSSEQTVQEMLSHYETDFHDNLNRLHGKAEFGVKVIRPADAAAKKDTPQLDADSGTSGKAYLMKKFEAYQAQKTLEASAADVIAAIDAAFSPIAAEKQLEQLKTETLILNAAYLIEQGQRSEFAKACEVVRTAHPELKYLFSGPWPPYSFIRLTKRPVQPA